ncbi:MAG: VCBS repeat-containing protein, partial [Planctomycetes bacterium]|nr:VCBS repeat-containing protein [Planctomycetota bacterium]
MKVFSCWIVAGVWLGSGVAEALGGADEFGAQNVIGSADQVRSVYAADLDGDGDADVLCASWADDEIKWYQNVNGLGVFYVGGVISTAADKAASVCAADLDGDGDADVLSASWADNKVAWYENTNGAGSFGAQQVISTAAKGPSCVSVADVDGDGDADVLSCSQLDGKVAWYENTNGLGSFGAEQVISTATNWAMAVA